MRCACPHCELYMIQSETGEPACCCPECGYRCNACMGTNTVISREALHTWKTESVLERDDAQMLQQDFQTD